MVKIIDTTGKRLPEHYVQDGLVRVDGPFDTAEDNAELAEWMNVFWREFSKEVEKLTGRKLPKYSHQQFDWVKFKGQKFEKTAGDHSGLSGKIRLSVDHLDSYYTIGQALAHEIFHFISQRKIAWVKKQHVALREGLSVIGKVFGGWGQEDLTYQKRSMGFLDEALVEIMSQRVLTKVSLVVPHLWGPFHPSAYPESRRMYHALVENIVLAWNDPSLRQLGYYIRESHHEDTEAQKRIRANVKEIRQSDAWYGRVDNLQAELGWSDQITTDQVEAVFERALIDRRSITEVARLINTMLGDGAFQMMVTVSAGIELEEKNGGYYSIWHILNKPVLESARHHQNVDTKVLDLPIKISASEAPSYIPAVSYEYEEGRLMSIPDVLGEYDALLKNPIKKDQYFLPNLMLAIQQFAMYGENIGQFYVGIARESRRLASTTVQGRVNNFCFDKICEELGVEQIIADGDYFELHGVSLGLTFFNVLYAPQLQLARVVYNDRWSTKNSGSPDGEYHFFVEK